MGITNATIANAEDYQRVLSTHHPVFLLFASQSCPACPDAVELFELIAARYPDVVSLVLDCANTPRHPEVGGTPTLLIYLNGQLQEKLKGFGVYEGQVKRLMRTFMRYANTHKRPTSSLHNPKHHLHGTHRLKSQAH
ncbi:thioredoxin domain-containing protein [Pseudomonas sp. O64]|uniref:thioredoxin domain-containing protein n=1 Tax=Pseudomonas TaxID=286 RepID=UPI000BA08F80|nr:MULTISPECIES: thioredoxin family protein [unclassified Pseudomonas]MCV2228336.1 thioredoxin family protein [Pseudomonas sp. AU10]OZO03252.1 thiol reductase thioredoxin [Pseudomonas sp. IB20]UNM17583.1 thioredoxin family protein [Pseudomonas sp. ArH3a]UXZ20377.1 thioredoxin family protein [Pseudomonas sp. YeP6b]